MVTQMKWIVETWDAGMTIEADECVVRDGLLMFTKDNVIHSVFAEWCFCCVYAEEEEKGKVVSLVK